MLHCNVIIYIYIYLYILVYIYMAAIMAHDYFSSERKFCLAY